MDLGWEMGLIAEFVFWMALFAQCWRLQKQKQKQWEVVRGFPHQLDLFLEGVKGFAAGLHLKAIVNYRDSSRVHFLRVV
jgi:hypothetical protein